MKKYFLISFLVLITLPQTTFASWWNPFTWNTFNKKTNTETQVLENRIKELENKLNNSTVATTSTFKNTQATTTKKDVLIKKTSQVTAVKTIINTNKETPTEFCLKFGENHVWNGTPFGQGKVICDCKTGFKENEKGVCVPEQITQQSPSSVPSEYVKPDGTYYSAEEVVNNRYAKCEAQNLVYDKTMINGEPHCITRDQSCDNKFKNSVFVKRDGPRADICNCKTGYVMYSGETSCRPEEKNNSTGAFIYSPPVLEVRIVK